MFHFPNRQAHRTVCRSAMGQTIHLLPGKYEARVEPCFYFPLPVGAKLVHFRCSSRGCVAGHKEKGEPQAELRQPETEPGGHEVAVRTGRSDESVDAAVRVLSPVNAAVPLPASRPQPYALLFPCLSRSIGCGLDRLKWDKVSEILEQVFGHSGISITVYSLPERAETTVMNENGRR